MLMIKEEHSRLLRQLLEDLEKGGSAPVRKPRVVLSGSLCEAPRTILLDLIEEAGMVVVDDDLYVGSRYFANDAGENGDPLAALADRYLERLPPSPTKVDSDVNWGESVVEMARRNRAAGVISLVVKFCPPHLAYYPDIERKVKESGISALMLETEHEVTSVEQVKTRLQAFRESLERH
jgi:benzoyl-CoA reductase/2-hydroxyglutaryl-CoA dehydratase subunit BcrC/BadD/HgdB